MSKLPKLAPHLVVNGGLAAIKFYEDAFDADTQFLMMAEDGKRVMHAALEINDSIIYLCDDFRAGSKPAAKQPAVPDGAVVMLHLQLKKPKHVDAIMQQAVAAWRGNRHAGRGRLLGRPLRPDPRPVRPYVDFRRGTEAQR